MSDTITAAEIWAVPIPHHTYPRPHLDAKPETVGEFLTAHFVQWWTENFDTDEVVDVMTALTAAGLIPGSLDSDGECSYPADGTDWDAGRDLVSAVIRSLAPAAKEA